MRLTKKQKSALEEAPLYFGQSESNLNNFYWTNGNNDMWWQPRTIHALEEKGLLVHKYDRHGRCDHSVLHRVDKTERPNKLDFVNFGIGDYDGLKKYSKAQDKYIEQLEKEKEWISVKDQPPEKEILCLVVIAGHVQSLWYKYVSGQWGYLGHNDAWVASNIKISHWTPVPKFNQ